MPAFLPTRGAATSTTAVCTPSLKPSPSWSGVSVAMGRCHSIDDWGTEKGGTEKGDRLLFGKQPVPFSTLMSPFLLLHKGVLPMAQMTAVQISSASGPFEVVKR